MCVYGKSQRFVALYCRVSCPAGDHSSLDAFYRELAWALLGVGQRSLALLVSRARYKVAPSAKAAGAQRQQISKMLGRGRVLRGRLAAVGGWRLGGVLGGAAGLLGVGQRPLALLLSRAMYKVDQQMQQVNKHS